MKIKYIIPVILTFVVGCNLDREPQDKIFSQTFWKTQDDAFRALMGCYAKIPESVSNVYTDAYSDNMYCQYPWESKATVASAGDITDNDDFGYDFSGIRRYNYFLDNIEKVSFSQELKNQYKAEVRTLRAWAYFNLATKFGDVPLFKEYITEAEQAKVAPTSEAEVINFVIQELEQSIVDLPSQPTVKSRLSKAAAYTLKARVHLFYGQYQQVVQATESVMQMGYSLFKVNSLSPEDYADDYSMFVDLSDSDSREKFYKGLYSYEKLFWRENKDNSEVILNQEFIEDNFNWISRRLLPTNLGGGWSSITPTTELVDSYWTNEGTTFTPPTPAQRKEYYTNFSADNLNYLNEFKNRDTRLYASILFPGAIWKLAMGDEKFVWHNNGKGSNLSKIGYNLRKFTDPNEPTIDRKLNNYPIIRYAEVLLMYAEAKNEISGPDASVFNAINQIRDRVAMPNVAEQLNQEQLREVIRNERRIELACEGFRWNDIRRWGISSQVMKDIRSINDELVQKRRWEAKFIRMPYPISSIDRNPKLKEAQKAKGY